MQTISRKLQGHFQAKTQQQREQQLFVNSMALGGDKVKVIKSN